MNQRESIRQGSTIQPEDGVHQISQEDLNAIHKTEVDETINEDMKHLLISKANS